MTRKKNQETTPRFNAKKFVNMVENGEHTRKDVESAAKYIKARLAKDDKLKNTTKKNTTKKNTTKKNTTKKNTTKKNTTKKNTTKKNTTKKNTTKKNTSGKSSVKKNTTERKPKPTKPTLPMKRLYSAIIQVAKSKNLTKNSHTQRFIENVKNDARPTETQFTAAKAFKKKNVRRKKNVPSEKNVTSLVYEGYSSF